MINDKTKANQEDRIGNECGVGVGLTLDGQRETASGDTEWPETAPGGRD